MIKLSYFVFLVLFGAIQTNYAQKYPQGVLKNLAKSGKNSIELKEVLNYYKNKPEKLQAAYFLISNMDCHTSQGYVWISETNKQAFPFNEFDYPSYIKAVEAFNILLHQTKLRPRAFATPDLSNIKAQYMIENIDAAFNVWKNRWSKQLPFEVFCEYILPYRIMDEPLTEWRKSYAEYFSKSFEKCLNKKSRDVCTFLSESYKNWFSDLYGMDIKKEPQHVLSARQILFRQQGYCEDMANWGVFMMRSLGIASTVDFTPYWATSTGGHFWQVALDEAGREIPFFMGDDRPAEFFMRREPSKVLRLTFSKQANTLAASVDTAQIPEGVLRLKNFIDVTDRYWKTSSLELKTPVNQTSSICYLAVFNGAQWRTVWWAKNKGKIIFDKMTCGVVYLPVIYKNGKEIPTGNPCLLKPDGTSEYLRAGKNKKITVTIPQRANYLIFRPTAEYTLYFWDNQGKWSPAGQKTTSAIVKPNDTLTFENVPSGALYILTPKYSKGKERPFTLDNNGNINYW